MFFFSQYETKNRVVIDTRLGKTVHFFIISPEPRTEVFNVSIILHNRKQNQILTKLSVGKDNSAKFSKNIFQTDFFSQ